MQWVRTVYPEALRRNFLPFHTVKLIMVFFFFLALCAPLRVCTFPLYVWVCVLYCGNFLWAPLPWLMDASCVPCLALSPLIYIKQCGTASVSLRLCCTCHLSICLPACLPASLTIRCLSRPGGSFHLFSALISSYFFLSSINLSEAAGAARLFVHACMCQLSFSICLWTQCGHFRRIPSWVLFSLLRCGNLILHCSGSLWLPAFPESSWVWHIF